MLESAERIFTIFSHVTPVVYRSEDFASLIALDSSSLINNPCGEFLVMQRRRDYPVPMCCSATISGDSVGNKSWNREEAAWTA